ncbi:hypothetical protein J4453_02430 [Candidatus Woesearchaeota archaeon]|nr:hypothetical protein [Candidatus Woesearchaeota archaeon]
MLTFLASLIAFSGLFAGIVLAYFTKEEQAPGKPYFKLMRNILLTLILLFFLLFLDWNVVISAVLSIALFVSASIFPKLAHPPLYFLLGAVLFLTSSNYAFFLVEAVLVFLYGLPMGSLWISSRKFRWDLSIVSAFTFFIPFLRLLL